MHKSFKKVWTKKIKEANIKATLFEHKKTKAEVLALENDDLNKYFSITFKTLPSDSTGVAHILEHCVLHGSRKYPVKDPFMKLTKTSLSTYLNASTYPDKTAYPVASMNDKDLENLTNVYLDAVFEPLIDENMFKQEGWHYELKTNKDDLSYRGVVFNEMKGALSNIDHLTFYEAIGTVYPDTTYGNVSGGRPENITDLTYSQFKNFYKTYYHPSNSKTILYGKIDVAKYLNFLAQYLDQYNYKNINNKNSIQKPWKNVKRVTKTYSVSEKTTKGCLVYALGFKPNLTDEELIALEILERILLGTEASPLKKALLESGLGEDLVDGGMYQSLQQPLFYTGLKGVEQKDFRKVENLIEKTLKDLSKNIDKDLALAAINRIDYFKRNQSTNANASKFMYDLTMSNWLYEKDPVALLKFEEPINTIRKRILKGEKYFENLIKKYFVNNKHKAIVQFRGDENLDKLKQDEEQKRLKEYKQFLTSKKVDELVKETEEFEKWQNSVDGPEKANLVPTLKLKDIKKPIDKIPTKFKKTKSYEILSHPLNTNGITYTALGLDLNTLEEDEISYLGILTDNLLRLGTKNHTPEEISILLNTYTGGMGVSTDFTKNIKTKKISKKLFISLNYLNKYEKEALSLLMEIISEPNLSNKKKLIQNLKSLKASMEPDFISMGHLSSLGAAKSMISESDYLDEKTSGIEFYLFLTELLTDIDSKIDDVIEKLKTIYSKILNRNNSIMNLTGESASLNLTIKQFVKILESLPANKLKVNKTTFKPSFKKVGFAVPSNVNYVAEAFDLYQNKYKLNGSIHLIRGVLSRSYLFDEIRVKGGAYGAMGLFDINTGVFSFASYRDPNVDETYKVYSESGNFLKNLKFSKEELEGSIIGAIGKIENYMDEETKGLIAFTRYLNGFDDKFRQKIKNELMTATIKDLNNFGKFLIKISEESKSKVTIGNKDMINDSTIKFNEVKTLF